MRIITGKFRGRKLSDCEKLKSLRPTTDKNREALFNILQSAKSLKNINFDLENSIILDLCCGSGAVGIEALSRGAKFVNFIDNNHSHLAIVKKNIELLKIEESSKIIFADAEKLPKNQQKFSLIFLDPPYEEDYQQIILSLLENQWLDAETLLVVESKKPVNLEANFGLKKIDERIYGSTSFGFFTKD
jgi:16S rRNA (guanine966-N2)-methyltransferase